MRDGVYVANVTPFRDDRDFTLDLEAYRAHVSWLAEHGVTGIVAFGTNGEGPSVATSEKITTLEALAGDDHGLDLVATLMEGNLPDTLRLLERLEDLPLGGVLVLPPSYFRPVALEGLRIFYERVLESTRHPVLAYHIPRYGVPVPAELVCALPVWGVKNSAGDADYSAAVRAGGRQVMLGTEDDLAGDLPDSAGAISALANIVPDQMVEVHRRARAGDREGAERLAAHLRDVVAVTKEHDSPAVLKVLAGAQHGIDLGTVRPPLLPVPRDYDVRAALARLGVVTPST